LNSGDYSDRTPMRGRLITFEGIDGCGKTLQLGLLADFLKRCNIDCIPTREPGGTALGRQIRSSILDCEPGTVEPLAELLLYAADRAQHVREIVRPALAAGRTVLSDRFYDATTAYQGYGRGFDLALVERLNLLATEGLRPDLTLLLDLDVDAALARIAARSNTLHSASAPDRLDREPHEFHARVRRGYLEIAAREPHRFRIIPASGAPDEIHKAVTAAVAPLMEAQQC
jgi:dTMP kinase